MSRVFEADDETFDREVVRESRPVLVDFSATWCGPCKRLEPVVHEIAGDYDGRLKVVKVDIDRAPNTAAKFAVLSVPTLLLFHQGAVRDQITGVVPKRAIAERVDKVL
jgi:thioredoxin 1